MVTRIGIYVGSMSGPGSGAWTRLLGLLSSMEPMDNVELHLFMKSEWHEAIPPSRNLHIHAEAPPRYVRRFMTLRRRLNQLIDRHRLDVLHLETIPVPRGLKCPVVLSIHDLREFHSAEIVGKAWWRIPSRILTERSGRRADRILTLTEWSATDICKRLGIPRSRISPVPHPVQLADPSVVQTRDERPFVLALGHLESRKNLGVLIEATQNPHWPPDLTLRIVGRDSGERTRLATLAARAPGRVFFSGPVEDERKWSLIHAAEVIAIPSLLEGFGIVATEGISVGTPVLVADRTALPEVVGVADAIVPADDPEAWALSISRLHESPMAREQLIQDEREGMGRFDPSHVGRDIVSAYLATVSEAGKTHERQGSRAHIIHLCYGGVGGHQAVVQTLARHHRQAGFRSEGVLVAPTEAFTLGPDSWNELDAIWPVSISRRADLGSMFEVFRIIRRRDPEVVVCHSHRHLPAAWLAMASRIRWPAIILAEHQQISLRSPSDDLWSLIGVILARRIVLLTTDYRERYRWLRVAESLRRPICIIPNGVEMAPEPDISMRWTRAGLTVGTATRLIPSKEIGALISACAILVDEDPDGETRLLIAGDGPDRVRLEQHAQTLGITDHVTFLGSLDNREMASFYGELDVYVQSTKGETLSMSILEAAAHSLPIVASRVPGVVDVLEDGVTAILFEQGNVAELADALRSLRDLDRANEFGTSARNMVLANYEASEVATRYLEMLGLGS
jgi:glycosyltransferase involved in cell wall biosynthesis